METLDIFSVVLPLGHAVGRVGCFFGGCCYGICYDGPFAVYYSDAAGLTPLHTPLLPIQLIEAVALLILFIIQLHLYGRKDKQGKLVQSYLLSYALIRFILEFFRGDTARGKLFFLSTSQWISLLVLSALALYLLLNKQRQKKHSGINSQHL